MSWEFWSLGCHSSELTIFWLQMDGLAWKKNEANEWTISYVQLINLQMTKWMWLFDFHWVIAIFMLLTIGQQLDILMLLPFVLPWCERLRAIIFLVNVSNHTSFSLFILLFIFLFLLFSFIILSTCFYFFYFLIYLIYLREIVNIGCIYSFRLSWFA